MDTAVFLLIWFCAIPLAAYRISGDVTEEEIFSGLLAWIDAVYHGTKFAKLFRCILCFSHWVIFAFALGFWECWANLPLPLACRPVAAIVCVFAAIEITNRLRTS